MAKIIGICTHIPKKKLSNEELVNKFGKWTAEKIYSKTGIKNRGISSENETAADLAIQACEKLFAQEKIDRSEIDMTIFVTQTHNQCIPTTACEIHQALCLRKECGAFDINQGCTGYIYGLQLANSLIESGSAKHVLVLTGDTYTKLIKENDASLATLFGDGASATIVSTQEFREEGPKIGSFEFGTDGSGAELIKSTYGGFRKWDFEDQSLYMNGAGIMEFTLKMVPQAVNKYLVNTNTKIDNYDKIILHQANKLILDRLYSKLGADNRGIISMEETGNTVSTSIPLILEGLLNNKSETIRSILLVGFGVGLSWGITSIRF